MKEDADLTQKQVSRIIGVSANHYGKYERGEADSPLEKAIILAEYYQVSPDYLAGRTNNKQGSHTTDLSDDELHLIEQYRHLTERSKGKHDVLERGRISIQKCYVLYSITWLYVCRPCF